MCNTFVKKYETLSDFELISLARANDQNAFEALFYRYQPLIKKIASETDVPGQDFDDKLQESTISFYYAVQMYDESLSAFGTFLSVCVDRSLKSTIRKASAQKRIPNDLITTIDDASADQLFSVSAEEEYFDSQTIVDVSNDLRSKLSVLEYKVLKSFLNTESYDLTAEELGVSRKSVDNALSRVRKKLNLV